MRRLMAVVVLLYAIVGYGQYSRTPVNIPDILGYKTLKCDFHMHSVFSDGHVWPDVRVAEAWQEGIDVISLTEHLEFQAHGKDIPTDHNRSHEIAKAAGDRMGITVIKGSEITRSMPPGHSNAIFIEDSTPLATEKWQDAFEAAKKQNAFIFYNHPGWTGQQPEGIGKWYDEHTMLLEKGMLHGVEIVNSREYYPEVHQWCIDKGLTILGNSDVHPPMNMAFDVKHGDHRPMTLVFADENSPKAIREALDNRRTAVYFEDKIFGDAKFINEIFRQSVKVISTDLTLKFKQQAYVQITNESEVPFDLELTQDNDLIEVSKNV